MKNSYELRATRCEQTDAVFSSQLEARGSQLYRVRT
jgi:hypothetical protein